MAELTQQDDDAAVQAYRDSITTWVDSAGGRDLDRMAKGQLRDAAEAGQAAADPSTAAADDASPGSGPAPPPRDATPRAILARRAMLAVDMTHIMGAPAELVHPFARAVEALARDLDDDMWALGEIEGDCDC